MLLKIVILSINLVVYNYSNLTCDWRCLWKWESGALVLQHLSFYLVRRGLKSLLTDGSIRCVSLPINLESLAPALLGTPVFFKQMVACTSDIQVAFTTDSSEVVLDLKIDELPKGSSSVYSYLKLRILKSSALYL